MSADLSARLASLPPETDPLYGPSARDLLRDAAPTDSELTLLADDASADEQVHTLLVDRWTARRFAALVLGAVLVVVGLLDANLGDTAGSHGRVDGVAESRQ